MYHPPYFAWGPPRRSVICPRGGTEPDVLRSVSRAANQTLQYRRRTLSLQADNRRSRHLCRRPRSRHAMLLDLAIAVAITVVSKVFIDAGANDGETTLRFYDGSRSDRADFSAFMFEVNPKLLPKVNQVRQQLAAGGVVAYVKTEAVWIANGSMELQTDTREVATGSSLFTSSPYAKGPALQVPTIDLSTWLQENFSEEYISLKLDIEGAEYEVLRKMTLDGTLCLPAELKLEGHARFRPDVEKACCAHKARDSRPLVPYDKFGCCGRQIEQMIKLVCPATIIQAQFNYSSPYNGDAPTAAARARAELRTHLHDAGAPSSLLEVLRHGRACEVHAFKGLSSDDTHLKSRLPALSWLKSGCARPQPRIFLHSTIATTADRFALLDHFLMHYRHELGIAAERCVLILQRPDQSWKDRKKWTSLLRRYAIGSFHEWVGEYDSATMMKLRKEYLHQRGVRGDDWLLHVDSDMLIELPAWAPTLHRLIERAVGTSNATAILALYVDRVSADGSIPSSIAPPPASLWEQFPLQCDVSVSIIKAGQGQKVVLYRGDLSANRGGGQIIDADAHYSDMPPLRAHHFKFFGNLREYLEKRIARYKSLHMKWWDQSQRLLDTLKKHAGIPVVGVCNQPTHQAKASSVAPTWLADRTARESASESHAAATLHRSEPTFVAPVTHGPHHHFFGYFDKSPWSAAESQMLAMRYLPNAAGLRSEPTSSSPELELGVLDLRKDESTAAGGDAVPTYRWRNLSRTSTWNYQQGCQLQWLGRGTKQIEHTVIFNTRSANAVQAVVMDVRKPTVVARLPSSVYAVTPCGSYALTLDYARLHKARRGYGYPGLSTHTLNQPLPSSDGIWLVPIRPNLPAKHPAALPNLLSTPVLVLSTATLHAAQPNKACASGYHWFNHVQFAPSGKRFSFFHRCSPGKKTRLFVSSAPKLGKPGQPPPAVHASALELAAGAELACSHYDWRNNDEIVSAGIKGWFVLKRDVVTHRWSSRPIFPVKENGHATWLLPQPSPWLISDTADSRKLFLFNVESGMRVNMHAFQSPQTMRIGELRLDLHPRGSPSGKLVSFDACDDTHGCQLFVMRLNASTMSPS